ncbi:hypothetical protein Tco_1170369, partial [Tanacetum coccineum]
HPSDTKVFTMKMDNEDRNPAGKKLVSSGKK